MNLIQNTIPRGKTVTFIRKRINLDASGYRLAADSKGLDRFYHWFGKSKITDRRGQPLRLFHAARSTKTTQFEAEPISWDWVCAAVADENIPLYKRGSFGRFPVPVYLSIENPLDLTQPPVSRYERWWVDYAKTVGGDLSMILDPNPTHRRLVRKLEAEGYDGIKTIDSGKETWLAFYPEQLRPAADPKMPFIRR